MTTEQKEDTMSTEQTHDQQEQQAQAAARLARQRIADLAGTRGKVALAVMAGEPGAEEEAQELDDEIARQERTATLADDAAREARRQAGERRKEWTEQERKEGRKKFDKLAKKRRELLEGFEQALEDLDQRAGKIVAFDRQQVAHATEHGLPASGDIHVMLGSRIQTRLQGLLTRAIYHDAYQASLVEVDPVVKSIAEIEGTQATEARRHEERQAERERLRELQDQVDARRRELNKETGARDPASTDARRAAAEREVEKRLGQEFPEYTPRGGE